MAEGQSISKKSSDVSEVKVRDASSGVVEVDSERLYRVLSIIPWVCKSAPFQERDECLSSSFRQLGSLHLGIVLHS